MVNPEDVCHGIYFCIKCLKIVRWRKINDKPQFYHWPKYNENCPRSIKGEDEWEGSESTHGMDYNNLWITAINDLYNNNLIHLLKGQEKIDTHIKRYIEKCDDSGSKIIQILNEILSFKTASDIYIGEESIQKYNKILTSQTVKKKNIDSKNSSEVKKNIKESNVEDINQRYKDRPSGILDFLKNGKLIIAIDKNGHRARARQHKLWYKPFTCPVCNQTVEIVDNSYYIHRYKNLKCKLSIYEL